MKQAKMRAALDLSVVSSRARSIFAGCIAVAWVASVIVPVTAQTSAPARPRAHRPATFGIVDVIKMSKAGLGDDLIIEQIKKQHRTFDLSTDELIQLKTASVSNRVIEAMINPAAAASPAAALAPAAPAATASSTPTWPSSSDATAGAAATNNDPPMPAEIGLYAKMAGQWTEVLPEVVNWKTGGALKSIASVGIVKGDVNGHVAGVRSKNSYPVPIEFLIVAPEGTALTEYQLLHLRVNGDYREFRTVTGGVMHSSGGVTRDIVAFEGKKLSKGIFSVVLPANLGAGEYGFLPPGTQGSSNGVAGKLYSFHVSE